MIRLALSGLCVFAMMVGFCVPSSLSAMEMRLPVTVDNPGAAPLTNHTIRLDLNAANAAGFDFTNNGDDLRIYDAAFVPIDFFVESVDPVTNTAVIWVEVPSVPAGPSSTQVFVDYNNTVPTPLSSAPNTFSQAGFRYHTQLHNAPAPGPETSAEGQAAFDFDTIAPAGSGYGCTNLNNIEVGNSDVFGANGDVAFSVDTIITVSTAGTYEFRLGTDYGSGGELIVDGATLEEGWTDDLWYANNLNSADTLTGSIFLDVGSYRWSTLGFERCCDGSWNADVSLNGGARVPLIAGNALVDLRAPSCPVANVTLGPVSTVPVTLSKFESNKVGPFFKFRWQTADETFSAGFNLWTLVDAPTEGGELVQLNRHLIRSHRFDSLETQSYKYRVNSNNVETEIDNVVISSVDINGTQEFFGPFDIGEQYGADYQSQPIDWQAVLENYEMAMRSRGFVKTKNRWRKARAKQGDDELSSELIVQVGVDKDGIVSVSHQDLLAHGVDWSGVKPGDIAVTVQGEAIPRAIRFKTKSSQQKRVFDEGGTIDFVGLAPSGEARIYNTERFYQLSIDRTKALRSRANRRKATAPQAWYYREQIQNTQRSYILSSSGETPWMMDVMYRTNNTPSTIYTFNVEETLQPNVPSHLNVELAGLTRFNIFDIDGDGEFDPDHRVRVYINDIAEPLSDIYFDGQVTESLTLALPAGVIKQGENSVRVEVADTGHFFDAIGIESVAINYPVQLNGSRPAAIDFFVGQSSADGLQFEASRRRDIVAYMYRDDYNIMRLPPSRVKNVRGSNNRNVFSVPFSAQGNSHYFVANANLVPSPKSIEVLPQRQQIDLVDTDLLIISHPVFMSAELEAYAEQRRLHGVQSQIVSTADIAAFYGTDIALHEAIKRFLIAANQTIDYQSVLLVGGHSYDYNHILSDDSINFIPTFYKPIGISRFTPTDAPLVDFDNDNYPEKEIGRWPVRTADNLNSIIAKSLLWAEKTQTRSEVGHRVLMLSDRVTNLPFENDLDNQLALLQMSDLNIGNVEKLYVDQLQASGEVPNSEFNQYVQSKVKQAIKNTDWLFYNGHGSPSTWSSANLLTSESINELGNQANPVLITSLGCYTTYYESPSHNSLAHQLLFSDGNGAVMIHGPSVVGGYEYQKKLADLITLKSSKRSSIGGAILSAKRALPLNYQQANVNWVLLGDPTLPLQ